MNISRRANLGYVIKLVYFEVCYEDFINHECQKNQESN
jgi:hypothetical protein